MGEGEACGISGDPCMAEAERHPRVRPPSRRDSENHSFHSARLWREKKGALDEADVQAHTPQASAGASPYGVRRGGGRLSPHLEAPPAAEPYTGPRMRPPLAGRVSTSSAFGGRTPPPARVPPRTGGVAEGADRGGGVALSREESEPPLWTSCHEGACRGEPLQGPSRVAAALHSRGPSFSLKIR